MATVDFVTGLEGSGSISNSLDASAPLDQLRFGDLWPDMTLTFGADGDDSGESTRWWHDKRTLGAGLTDTITFGASLTNGLGEAFNPTGGADSIRAAIFAVDSPNGTKSIRLGPQGDANACALGIAGTSTAKNAQLDVTHWIPFLKPVGGFTPGTHVLITNPGAGSIDYWIFLLAEQA